jgi:hypothetical protein
MLDGPTIALHSSHGAVMTTDMWLLSSPMQLNISLFAFNLLVPAYPLVRPQYAVNSSVQLHCLHE